MQILFSYIICYFFYSPEDFGKKLPKPQKKIVTGRNFQELPPIDITFYTLKLHRSPGVESHVFTNILFLINSTIFRGFEPGLGHINVQELGNNPRYWHET